jgi:hypothetical protein
MRLMVCVLGVLLVGQASGQTPKKGFPLKLHGNATIHVHVYLHLVPPSCPACRSSTKEPESYIVPEALYRANSEAAGCCCPEGCSCPDWCLECQCEKVGKSGAKCCPCEAAGGCCCDPCRCGLRR